MPAFAYEAFEMIRDSAVQFSLKPAPVVLSATPEPASIESLLLGFISKFAGVFYSANKHNIGEQGTHAAHFKQKSPDRGWLRSNPSDD